MQIRRNQVWVIRKLTRGQLWSQPPKKPPPHNPNRSGSPKLKGKGKAKVATPEKETQADQPEASSNYDMSQDEGLPKCESKKAQKCQLANEAEEAMAWATLADRKEVWGTA
jgi:hypothetical protein